MVNSNTKRILIIACRVPGVEEEKVREAAELARRLISKSCRRDLQSC
jgi:DNA/RNA-binding domain of Phe-tRNA-synthetase-like protein